MNTSSFWVLIAVSRRALLAGDRNGSMARQAQSLRDELVRMQSPPEVVEFERIMVDLHHAAYSWDLWGAAYVIAGGCSDDSFFDFRNWLISAGRETYDAALADPESLVEAASDRSVEDTFFEEFVTIPRDAYFALTGKEIPATASKHPPEPRGNRWETDAELAVRYPRLWTRFRTKRST